MIKLLLLAVVPFMTQHRNVVPKTEVSTNFYGSVTGIVDKAYIEARVGVGGGGGIDTNTVDALANSAVVTNALTVATTNRVAAHVANINNPHAVTAEQVGALSKDGGIITGSLVIGVSTIEDDESLSADKGIRAIGGFSRFSDSWVDVYPKLKWMGDYFEDSISGENGRIYIPYTDAPWIDAIKAGSVKGLALYSDLDGFLKSESDPVFTEWLDGSFSNAVLAVNVDFATNTTGAAYVAVTNALAGFGFDADALAELPGGKVYGSVGALLAALAAAVAWLKKNKVQTLKLEDGSVETSADGGVAKLNDFFTESNSLLNGRITYSHNATGLKDRAFNALTFDGTEYNLSTALQAVSPTASGQPRDLLIVATATAATTISFTAGTIKGDKPTIDGSGTWLITLTEYASGVWYCRQIKMEDAQ